MSILQKQLTILFTALLVNIFCLPNTKADTEAATDIQRLFFEKLNSACNTVFQGYSSYPKDPDHPFAGKLLVAHLASCDDNKIRIPFTVGEDHSRTWIITYNETGSLTLKHDHRHADGEPDNITNYGGTSIKAGSEYSQYFSC